jgi:hypothetical protein
LLTDSANLTFNGSALAVTGTLSATGNITGSTSLLLPSTTAAIGFGVGATEQIYRIGNALRIYANSADVATFSSTGLAVTGTFSSTLGATIQGLTVGLGAGAVSTNTAVGTSALAANTSGSINTAVGYQAGYSNTTGGYNYFAGAIAGRSNTTGNYNSFAGGLEGSGGLGAGYYNTTGSSNSAFGSGALANNTTASNNTAVGYQAGYTGSTNCGNSTLIGYQAGYTQNNGIVGASENTFVGYKAGYGVTTGVKNTFIGGGVGGGVGAGGAVTTGYNNTILGTYTGNQGGLDIRTANNFVVLSDGDGNVCFLGSTATNATYFRNDGAQMYPGTDNTIKLGYPSFRWTTVYATTGTINTSDANQKQDIASLDDAEKRVAVAIKSLIKKYRFKDAVAEKGDAARIHIGAVAQEVQAAFVAEGLDPARYALFCSDTWYEVDGKSQGKDLVNYTAETDGAVEVTRLGLRYDELLAFIISAL